MEPSVARSPAANCHPTPSALPAYEVLAPFYDRYTADYEHDRVLEQVEALALEHGLTGRRVLDVGCGTGKSFLPLLERGYDVTGCDISPRMVERARGKLGQADAARVVVADMRALPWRRAFDLVTCLDDGLNYLLTESELTAALRSIAGALRRGGLAIFDVNSLRTYRETFAEDFVVESGQTVFEWRGEGSPDVEPGGVCSAVLDVRVSRGRLHATSRHTQRHHPRATVEAACARAGMRALDVRGVARGAHLVDDPDEDVHRKLVFVAGPAAL
ncbi:MAG TPA: class I SAM-dependent methyltransferase [Solirubrobacteraceae bacterium]|nr:class I SAM-dependent methyltransferase [Solirubrobacteraceae bacterium]